MAVTKSLIASSSVRMMMNPCWVHSIIYPHQNAVGSGDRVEEWGPLPMVWWMVSRENSGPTSTRKTKSAYSSSRDVVGWPEDRDGVATVGRCAALR